MTQHKCSPLSLLSDEARSNQWDALYVRKQALIRETEAVRRQMRQLEREWVAETNRRSDVANDLVVKLAGYFRQVFGSGIARRA